MNNVPKYLIIHHSGGTDADPLADSSGYTVQQCNVDHKARWNASTFSTLGWYVGYQYFIDRSGNVTQCRADNETGAHTIGFNNQSIGICLAGNFDLTIPTIAQVTTLEILLSQLIPKYNIQLADTRPHRDFAVKTCYGRRLNGDWARGLMADFYGNRVAFFQKVIADFNLWLAKVKAGKMLGAAADLECHGIIH